MKTTVSAAFLMLLVALESTAQQQYYPYRYHQSTQQANLGYQPYQPVVYPYLASVYPAQPVQLQDSYQVPLGSQHQTDQVALTQFPNQGASASAANPGNQHQGGQSQYPQQPNHQQVGQVANRIGANNDQVLPNNSPSKTAVDAIWNTPDPRSTTEQSPRSTPRSTRNRSRSTNNPETIVDRSTSSSKWKPTTRKPGFALALDAVTPKRTQSPPRARPPTPTSATTAPPEPSSNLLFEKPGGSTPGSEYNALDAYDPDRGADSGFDINKGLRQFALDLLMDMTEASPSKNVVLSPYSIWAVMLVIYEGAEGQTASQIAATLKFNHSKEKVRKNYKRLERALQKANNESHSDFVSGNGVFYDRNRPPLPEFSQLALNSYQCHLQALDFSNQQAAVNVINDWVSDVTHKRIKTLVKSEDVMRPELIITNALFFKGQWKIPFNLSATHTDKFYNERKEHISNVRMMYQKGEYMYSFIAEIGAHVLDMPYEDSKFRMLVVLPKPASTVSEVLRLMKRFPVDQCYERLVHEQEMFAEDEVHVYLPRFKFGNRVEVKQNLQRLGITDVFDSSRANLRAMSSLQMHLGKVFHVSEIEVSEEGTIASAATAGAFVNKMGPPKFLANRPFAYFIVENSQKTVIFAGKVADPTKSSH